MANYSCSHCQIAFSVRSDAAPAEMLCPSCEKPVSMVVTTASRWFIARDKKKHGPYSWKQLQSLAERTDLRPDDMVLQEGAKQWCRADSIPELFADTKITPKPASKPRSTFPWMSLAGATAMVMFLAVSLSIGGYLYFRPARIRVVPVANNGKTADAVKDRTTPNDRAKSIVEKTSITAPSKVDKKPLDPVKPPPSDDVGERFLASLNTYRKAAGLGSVALDTELSRGCLAHAKYLARNVDPQKADAAAVQGQDPSKPEATPEGKATAATAMVAFLEPSIALERWIGRLFGRAPLLTSEMQSIGLGFEKRADGWWVCVVDPVRGRGDPVVVYPIPKQADVPLSFSGGLEVPEGNQAAGFPISVTFAPTQKITNAALELRDDKGKPLEGWLWTPEKPVRPGAQRNSIALIPKSILHRAATYHAKASADVDGKPWSLAWSFTAEDDSDSRGIWAKQALDKVNTYRKLAGLKPVVLDGNLSKGCLAHARYLVINADHPATAGLKAHDEDLTLPGASKEGQIAGKASDIAIGDYEPTDGVDAWMATLYHRVPILEPNLQSIGFGCARGRRQGWVTVLNVLSGRDRTPRPHAVLFPAPDQIGVPLNFPNGGEEPNPIPDDKDGKAGYPITAFFPEFKPLKNASAKLTNAKGDEVACWFSSLEKPANPKFPKHQGNTVCLVPHDPLLPRMTYHVELQGQLDGTPWQKKWSFTTGESGLSIDAAKKQVLDRINRYRAEAGLSAVVTDEKLERGCQLHAQYLMKHADMLIKTKASVNDEDPLLDGFTAEGAHSARQSDVFSNAPTPLTQIDDLMATFMRRVFILDPEMQRIGFGCAHDVGRGWRCVLDLNGGRGSTRVTLFPAPNQENVPTLGFDRIEGAPTPIGLPISVVFPRQATLRNAQAVLVDADQNAVEIRVSSPEKPLNDKLQRSIIGVHPLAPLGPGQIYSVTISVRVDGEEWRRTWQFTTAGK